MPQINKIRIVNFSYNDGNRFIPDELYDLASDKGEALNSLFNLNNGGGKTVLVQLMMQPVHPRAMAGGRRIEEYFGRSTDHSYILVEWNLDDSDDKLLTGISIAGSSSNNSDDNLRGNTIRYYTFKTVYENYPPSPYSIASLELSKNENGRYVPASFDYVREKAKNSRGLLEYYSSDEGTKWTNMLAEYGIYRSEWETVIEVLNKDEGGLNQYFDEAKTSDKLIAKFFIPAIENKMKSAVSNGTDSSLETMLINYARRISEKDEVIRERDINRRLIESLSQLETMSDDLYSQGERLSDVIGEVCGFKASLGKKGAAIESDLSGITSEIQSIDGRISHIEHEEKSKEYYEALDESGKADEALSKAREALEVAKENARIKKHEEDVLLSAKLYRQIKDAESEISALKTLIEEKENDSEDAEQIARLKYSVYMKGTDEAKALTTDISHKENSISEKTKELQSSEDNMKKAEAELTLAREKYNQANSRFETSKENTDSRVASLNIAAVRMLDGFYADKDIEEEKKKRDEIQGQLTLATSKIQNEIQGLEKRKNEIPGEKADAKIALERLGTEKKDAEEKLSEYNTQIDELRKICGKYCLDETAIFSERLESVLAEERELTSASIRKNEQDREILDERIKAAREGHVHILPSIMDYVASTGIMCQTGEEYISGLLENGSITKEKADEIMEGYPEFVFSLLFNNEKELKKLLSAGNVDWLPAVVPLFTMEQINALMNGELETLSYLAAYDRSYFQDRDGYLDRLSHEKAVKEEQIKRLQDRLTDCNNEIMLAERFDYTDSFHDEQEKTIQDLSERITGTSEKIKLLDKELENINEELHAKNQEFEQNRDKLQEVSRWMESFAELVLMLSKETEWYNKLQEASIARNHAETEYKKVLDDVNGIRTAKVLLEKECEQSKAVLARVNTVLESVSGAKEAEIIDGELEGLYSQYQTMVKSMSDDIEKLRINLEETQEKKNSLEDELGTYSCEKSEYEAVQFTPDLLKNAKKEAELSAEDMEKCQESYSESNARAAYAKQRLDQSLKALEEFENNPLPMNEIGDDFKARIRSAKQDIAQLNEKSRNLINEKRALDRIFDNVGDVLRNLQFGDTIKMVTLSDHPENQWDEIKRRLSDIRNEFAGNKNKLLRDIGTTVTEFKDIALSEIVNKLGAIGDILDDPGMKGDRLYTVCESIGTMTASIEKINSKIETDLKEIENDFGDIVDQCVTQGKRMYQDLRTIAASSKAHIFEGKPQTQMVRMDLPEEKEISEEASRVSIKTEIEKGAGEIKELIKSGADDKQISKRARAIVSSERLLHKYIRQESIQIKVYKIDMNSANSVYKRWEDTLTQSSGAEKFVVFFSVVLTLMNYTRSAAGVVSRNVKSVLILDNPFGKITSAHLLKPMFDIAKHFNVQLICLSDINKSDVVGCFDCVIKLVIKTQNLSNFEIMTHEGNERIEHGYYKIMNGQMSLF